MVLRCTINARLNVKRGCPGRTFIKMEGFFMKTMLVLLMGFALAASAQPRHGGPVVLGEANVDGGVDHDRIAVTAARGEYRAIQLRVENAPVRFDRVVVHYGNGASEPLAIRHRVPAGSQTRAIDLPGQRRVIESVEFWYERGNWRNGRRPRVVLMGIR
jgi:hypothetical protein